MPVINEKVSFALVNSGNGGTLVASNDRTGSDGQVTALFTSGNSMYSDNVRVITSVGATASIYINKTGGLVRAQHQVADGSPGGRRPDLRGHGKGGRREQQPRQGVPVTFTIPVNTSGAVFSRQYRRGFTTYTDSGGYATAVYRAGSNFATSEVFDSVMAELIGANDSSNAVNITRSAGTTPTTGICRSR